MFVVSLTLINDFDFHAPLRNIIRKFIVEGDPELTDCKNPLVVGAFLEEYSSLEVLWTSAPKEPNALITITDVETGDVLFTETFKIIPISATSEDSTVLDDPIIECKRTGTIFPESTIYSQKYNRYFALVYPNAIDNPNGSGRVKSLTYLTNSSAFAGVQSGRRKQNMDYKLWPHMIEKGGTQFIKVTWYATRDVPKGGELLWLYSWSHTQQEIEDGE